MYANSLFRSLFSLEKCLATIKISELIIIQVIIGLKRSVKKEDINEIIPPAV
jgi:hypothetical protein